MYPRSQTVNTSRDCRSPPPPNMGDFVYKITVPPSPNGSPNRGGGKSTYVGSDDRRKDYYDDRSHHSVGRSTSINRRDRSRPRSTHHGGGSRRSARSVRSSRSRASTHGRRYYSSDSELSDEYDSTTSRSRSRKRSSSGYSESHDPYRESDDDYDYRYPIQKPSANNSAMAPWAAPSPNPASIVPPPPPPHSPPRSRYPGAPRPQPLIEQMQNLQKGVVPAKGLIEQQQQRNQSAGGAHSSYGRPYHLPSSHAYPYHHPLVARAQGTSQSQSSETSRDQPRSILRTSSLPPPSLDQDPASRESNTNTQVASYDLEHRLSIMENRLASLGSPYTHPPPQFPPPPPLPATPARKPKSVSLPIPENHAI